jgi:anti-sigma factor RsiW
MNRSERTPISDELLSAYIDGAVTNQERATVEAAISADPALAWEVESLRRTVELVQALPPIALPRSFVLREDQVADVLAERRARATAPAAATQTVATPAPARMPRQSAAPPRRSFWTEFLAFFNSGNLLLRNATAVAAVLFVVVMVTSPGLAPYSSSMPALTQDQADLSASPASQPELALAQTAEEPAGTSADVQSADAQTGTQNEEAEPASAKAAPASAPPAPAAAAMEAAPAGMDAGVAAASMPVGPEGQDASAARMMPEPRGGGADSGADSGPESGPALFQAAPAALAPFGGESALGDIPDQGEIRRPMDAGIGAAPAPESVADVSAAEVTTAGVPETEVAVAKVAADVPADAPAVEESSPAVAAQSAPAELSEEPLAKALQAPPASVGPDSTPMPVAPDLPWAYWGWLQAAVGGLALLLAALWLYTRRA